MKNKILLLVALMGAGAALMSCGGANDSSSSPVSSSETANEKWTQDYWEEYFGASASDERYDHFAFILTYDYGEIAIPATILCDRNAKAVYFNGVEYDEITESRSTYEEYDYIDEDGYLHMISIDSNGDSSASKSDSANCTYEDLLRFDPDFLTIFALLAESYSSFMFDQNTNAYSCDDLSVGDESCPVEVGVEGKEVRYLYVDDVDDEGIVFRWEFTWETSERVTIPSSD